MLAAMFSGRHTVCKDSEKGYVFIDRDGKHFRHILNWLRDGVAPISNLSDLEHVELLREAEYYQLLGLVDRINEVLNKKKEDEQMNTDLTRTDIIKCVQHAYAVGGRVRLTGVNLSGLDLSNLNLSGVDFSFACLKNAIFSRASFHGAIFRKVDAENTNFQNAELTKCVFTGANLRGALLAGAVLQEAKLSCCGLRDVDLSSASLQNAELRSVDLEGANLEEANLKGATFYKANMKGANLQRACLFGVSYLWDTCLEGAKLDGATGYYRMN